MAYSNSFGTGLLFDNGPIVQDDPRIREVTPQNIDAIWSKGYWYNNQDPTLYRPLTTFTYLFNYAVLGNANRPTGYHWINLLLHAINTLLVYAFGLVIFRKIPLAGMFAAIWSLHPILTESVTNIVGRADMLSGLGVLTALLCHIQAGSAEGARRYGWLAGVLAGAGIAVYSKESGVVLIALMVLYDLLFRMKTMRAAIAGYVAVLIPFGFYFYLRAQVLSTLSAAIPQFYNNPMVAADFLHSRLTAIQVIGRYLFLLAWPQTLSPDYSYNQVPVFRGAFQNWADWATILALLVCLAAAGVALACRRRVPAIPFFIGFFFIALAPGANIAMLLVTIMAERFLYLPSLGFVGCLVWALYALARRMEQRWPRATAELPWVAAVLCLALLVRTHMRNSDWDNERQFWSSAVKAAPNSYKTHVNLATVLYQLGGPYLDQAIAEDDRSLAILKGLPPEQLEPLTMADIGGHNRYKGDMVKKAGGPDAEQQARSWYEKSLGILLRGEAADRVQEQQLAQVNRAKGLPADFIGIFQVYQELGQTYIRLDQPDKAIETLEFGLYVKPVQELFKLLSTAYDAKHDQDGAAVALMEGVLLMPNNKALPSELLRVYEKRNPPGCAVQDTGAGKGLNLECPLVHGHVCAAAAKLQEYFTNRHEPGEAAKMQTIRLQSLGCPAQ